MRKKWNRGSDLVQLTNSELTDLIQSGFPGDEVLSQEYAEGGLANTNIRVQLKHHAEPLMVRINTRDPAAREKEHRLLDLVASKVPAPKILAISSTPVQATVLTYLPGKPFEDSIDNDSLDSNKTGAPEQRPYATIASAIGRTLAHIHSFQFPHCGFFDSTLNVANPFTISGAGTVEFAKECLMLKGGSRRLGQELSRRVIEFLIEHGEMIDGMYEHACLTHSDFNPSNILVDGEGHHVTGIIDWEFAFSGNPLFDFGNLLRPPVETLPGFMDGFTEGYTSAGGTLPPRWREASLLVDLTAWFDFMTRERVNEALIDDAKARVEATMDRVLKVGN